jgi:hypothetical protein
MIRRSLTATGFPAGGSGLIQKQEHQTRKSLSFEVFTSLQIEESEKNVHKITDTLLLR